MKRGRKELALRQLPDSVVLAVLRVLEPLDRLRAIEALRLRPSLREELGLWPLQPPWGAFFLHPELSIPELRTTRLSTQRLTVSFEGHVEALLDRYKLPVDSVPPARRELHKTESRIAEIVFLRHPFEGKMEELGRLRLCVVSAECVSVRLLPWTQEWEAAVERNIEFMNRIFEIGGSNPTKFRVVRLPDFGLTDKHMET